MKKSLLSLVLGALLASQSALASQEAVIEIPVQNDKATLSDGVINGGPILRVNPEAGGSLMVKCNPSFRKTDIIVFVSGVMFKTQLAAPVESMESCRAHLQQMHQNLLAGDSKIRIEVNKDHSVVVNSLR